MTEANVLPRELIRMAVFHRWLGGLLVCVCVAFTATAYAQLKLPTNDPVTFFTNLASRLLKSELNLDLAHLQVWPTNQYTPAVHRLLQVTANLYDATTNRFNADYPHLPTVFHPLFTNDGGGIFICGYAEEPGAACLSNRWLDLNVAADRDALQATDYVYGVPFVIGAKKGFPDFNEFSMQSVFKIMRRLQITRPSVNVPISSYQTNQMFVMGITNYMGVEAWNSYRSNYARAVDIIVADALTMVLTNDAGLVLSNQITLPASVAIPTNDWAGTGLSSVVSPSSFRVLISTGFVFLADSIYRYDPPSFSNDVTLPFETGAGFPNPQWGLGITNRLRLFMVDHETQRLVDFVTLEGLDSFRDLSTEIAAQADSTPGFGSLWDTNRIGGSTNIFAPPRGVIWQVQISLGNINAGTTDWLNYGTLPPGQSKNYAIDYFRAFFHMAGYYYQSLVNTQLVQDVPFTPALLLSRYQTWQANDPLVHYTLPDLRYLALTNELRKESVKPGAVVVTLANIGKLNDRYQPWGGNPYKTSDPDKFNAALKDPLVRCSDDWNFPDSEPLSLAMLGRVHRGTPWQTVYLKSAPIDSATWQNWTGNADPEDAARTQPQHDWHLASLLGSLLNTNRPHDLASPNPPSATNWLSALDGLTVWTNSMTDAQIQDLGFMIPPGLPVFDSVVMAGDSPQATLIADAITATRAAQPGGVFRDPGDVLATPELSLASLWLNQSSSIQLQGGITDEAYEKIPSQLLVRLRPESIGTLTAADDQCQLQFTGVDGYPYIIETSSNLSEWLPVCTNTPTNGVFQFTEPLSESTALRFYRSVLLP